MLNRLQPLENDQLVTLHNANMKLLSKVGVVFHDAEAVEIFKKHGFKVDGKKVYFSEDKIQKALETVPSEFMLQARNPEKSIIIGGDHFIFGPGWGASLIIDANGERRQACFEDQNTFCKLVQTSPYLDLVAGSMAIPAELSPRAVAASMLASCFTLTDMPLIANPCSRENGHEVVEMATIAWGGEAAIKNTPISIRQMP